MIKSWSIANFKSFKDHRTIDLAPINVLAGANSSGKSSIIQSILLLKQTLQYGSENRPITLNGPLVRLGAFDDVRNFSANGEELLIGFEFEFRESELAGPLMMPWARLLRRQAVASDPNPLRSLSLSLSYDEIRTPKEFGVQLVAAKSLTPNLTGVELKVSRVSSEGDSRDSFASFVKTQRALDEEYVPPFKNYDVYVDDESLREVAAGLPDAKLIGGILSYFLPSWLAIQYDENAKKAVSLTDAIFRSGSSIFSGSEFDEEVVPSLAVHVINDWLEARALLPQLSLDSTTVAQLRDILVPYFPRRRGLLTELNIPASGGSSDSSETADLKERVLEALITFYGVGIGLDPAMPKSIRASTDFIKEYFKQGIRYLGPLRDNPRPVYQLEALESTTDVGYRGEHTAAVLDLNANLPISYHRPPFDGDPDGHPLPPTEKVTTVREAVVEWLTYLGVADDIMTEDAGVFGNRLRVSVDGGERFHDLTNVGVGVSQVLPIVVMALLAPRGSFLIFEQPELHLHPKVQARLGDFFLALAQDGKQMLLETHSEYLVDRFRLRIALDPADTVRQNINILFSVKEGGESNLVPVEISEFGAITNWPKDFFEQSQRDVSKIIKAASSKRKTKGI